MVMSTPDDNLIPAGDTLFTARRYSAEQLEFPGIGHDLIHGGIDVDLDVDAGGLGRLLVAPSHVVEDALDGDDARRERRGAVFVLCEIEQILETANAAGP